MSQRSVELPIQDQRWPLLNEASHRRSAIIVLAGFSVFYFAYVILLASGRYFWIDEISAVLNASAPNFSTIWNSPKHIPDFQTAAFFIVIRASRAVFGAGLIGTRIAPILGVYTFCVSLFILVWRRVGILGGLVTLLFPLLTGALPYAYEARPYGIQMGFAGLALLCWQFAMDNAGWKWIVGFSLCLFGALLMQPFAICLATLFAIPEFLHFLTHRRIRWSVVGAITVPIVIAGATYLPVIAGLRSAASQVESQFTLVVPNNVEGITRTVYDGLYGPCVTVLAIVVAMLFIGSVLDRGGTKQEETLSRDEAIIAIAFFLAPILGALLALAEKGHFYTRYMVWSVAGVSLMLGMKTGQRHRNYFGIAVVLILMLSLARDFSTPVRKRLHGDVPATYVPGEAIVSYVHAGDPLALHDLLDRPLPDLPIFTDSVKDFVYVEYYSPTLRPRMRYVFSGNTDYGDYYVDGVRDYLHVPFTAPLRFVDMHFTARHFLFYGTSDGRDTDLIRLVLYGAHVNAYSNSHDGTHFLADVEYPQ
jgi:hypothetical protein